MAVGGESGGGGGGGGSSLPNEIVQSIAISNAKSIGEQPAILANMALANQILNNNLQQQMQIANQQAMNQIVMATMSKCVAMITGGDGDSPDVKQILQLLNELGGRGAGNLGNPPAGGSQTP